MSRRGRYVTVALSAALYLAVIASRGSRYPFDDEGPVLALIDSASLGEIIRLCLHAYDLHPPLSYVIFFAAHRLGMDAAGLQWLSACFTAASIAIWCWMALESLDGAAPALAGPIALLFALTPLAVGQGDAIRWYPPFTLLVAIAYAICWRGGRWWWLSAIALGLAADCEFIAILPFAAILLHRYAMRRSRAGAADALFVAITAITAIPAFVTMRALRLPGHSLWAVPRAQLRFGIVNGILANALGFTGGGRLGISLAWLAAIAAVCGAWLFARAWRSRRDNGELQSLCELVAMTGILIVLVCLVGFGKPRSFLFFAPMASALVAIGFTKAIEAAPLRAAAAFAGIIAVSLGVLVNLQITRSPFKRNLAVPYEELVDFVTSNARGNAAVLTSDYITGWLLRGHSGICVAQFEFGEDAWISNCPDDARFERVIVVRGRPLDETDPVWKARIDAALARREPIAQAHFGFDHDTALKNRLAHRSLPQWILSVDVYR
jgi:hypothetical protein